jgi:alkanesulfonate monooxygenase SsuD/methylene tetrahydromethanopterin reductase-like flavin-dependent oxidoreductase (luciferase family)
MTILWDFFEAKQNYAMRRVKFGCMLGGDLESRVRTAQLADRHGFDSVWSGDHLTFWYPDSIYPETWSTLLAAGMHTSRVTLGSSVVDTFRRHPSLLAQTVASIDRFTHGRTILGIGAGEPMNNTPFGIEWGRPARRLREAIEVIKGLWESSPTRPMNYDGEVFKLREAYLMINPETRPHPPVYVSSSARLTRKIVAEMGDGWIAHIHSPKTFGEDLKEIENNAKLVGRDPKEIDRVAFLLTALSKDEESGFESAKVPVGMELLLAQDVLKRIGYLPGDTPGQLDLRKFTATPEETRAIWKFAEGIDRRAIEQTSLFGTPDKCIETIERFEQAGATHVELAFVNKNLEETFRLFEEKIIPHFE